MRPVAASQGRWGARGRYARFFSCLVVLTLLACGVASADSGDDASRSALLIDPVPERPLAPQLTFPGAVTVPMPSVDATFDLDSAIEHARRSSSSGSGVGFYNDYLIPRLYSNFINISTLDLTPLPGRPVVEESTRLTAVHAAETCAQRAARHALRGYLLDRTGLEDRSERIKEEFRSDESATAGPAATEDRWSFVASTSHFLPRVSMRYRLGADAGFTITLYGTGSVGLEYLKIRGTYNRVYAGYDSEDDVYELMFRRSF